MTDDEEFYAFANEVMAKLDRLAAQQLGEQARQAEDYHWPPPPNTAHPALEQQAGFVRSMMAVGRDRILLPRPASVSYLRLDGDVAEPELRTSTLTVHRVCGLAPYVGDPFVYVWKVAVDEAKRWVAGESHDQPTY